MSQMTINCPHCSQQVLGDTAYAGQALACPSCGGEFVMPGDPAPQQQHETQHGHVAPAPQLKRTGRPNLRRAGVGVRSGPVVTSSTAGRPAPSQQQHVTAASQQMAPATQQIPGGTSGLMYQTPAGFGKLWADPVTGQREACDGMGSGKCVLFGMIFLFGVPILIDLISLIEGARMTGKAHFVTILSGIVFIALLTLSVWLFGLMSGKQSRFGEVLVIAGFATFWAIVFFYLTSIIGQAVGRSLAMSAGSFGDFKALMVILPLLFAAFSFITIIYGAFRNLCGASGAASFWLSPVSIFVALLLFWGYMRILAEIL